MECPACGEQHGTLRQYRECIKRLNNDDIKEDIKDVDFGE